MIQERHITASLHTNGAMAVMTAAALCAALPPVLLSPLPQWAFPGMAVWQSALGAVAVNLLALLLVVYINKTFNILRSPTKLCAGMFMVMQMAIPEVFLTLSWASLLTPAMLFVAIRLFASFNDPRSQRSVFTVFFLLGCATLAHVFFAFFFAIALMGCAQMRILGLRTLLAALLGAITPFWLVLGFGMIDPVAVSFPAFSYVWHIDLTPATLQAVVATAFTLVVGITFTVLNLLKILSYNARVRAFNGFLTLLFLATGLIMAIDFANFRLYVPLLSCLSAYQVSHFFTYRRARRAYIPILLFVVVYFGLYYWNICS